MFTLVTQGIFVQHIVLQTGWSFKSIRLAYAGILLKAMFLEVNWPTD